MASALLSGSVHASAQTPAAPPPAPQNPSPMVENTRAHRRIAQQETPGNRRSFIGPLEKSVQLYLSLGAERAGELRLVVFFHGPSFIPEIAVSKLGGQYAVATVNLGPGSGVYDRTFSVPAAYDSLLAQITRETTAEVARPASFSRVTLVGFSAGHGAIRAILRDARHFDAVDAVLLLDGLHTSYVPEETVMEKGGALDTTNLNVFVRYARAAMRGEKQFVVTHSEIFPGTFASTTETADYLVQTLGLRRTPVLRWGPNGMQQLSEVRQGRFEILGFAGNTGPDHIDHVHGMPDFLGRIERR
ncbi:MAG: hypothetical protein K0S86_1296 [Geminicoccaceae bacterium]|nr:hypothetical protein [Geminicoccaceae bacterium]